MSIEEELVPIRSRWLYSRPKLLGWLVGLFTAAFGGLMFISPGAAYLMLPQVIVGCGLALSLSYSIAMSASTVRPIGILGLLALGLALVIVGRYHAPIVLILEAIRTGKDSPLLRRPGVTVSLAISMLIVGVQILQLALPWIRDPGRLAWWRSTLSLVLIESGTIALGIGAVLTARTMALAAQPYWVWLAMPLVFGLGLGLRVCWRGWLWIMVTVALGATLPVLWLMIRHQPV